jgi:hypothetical protein
MKRPWPTGGCRAKNKTNKQTNKQTGFSPGGSGRYTCTKIGKRQLYTKGKSAQNNTTDGIHKMENKNAKQKTSKNNITKHKSSN